MKTSTGNSRLIFQKRLFGDFDYVQSLKKVDAFIEQSQKLTKANPYSYIYFFTSSSDELLFHKTPCWSGREVIGFASNEVIEEAGLGMKDLEGGEIHSFPGPDSLEISDLLKLEREIRDKFEFVSTWRVRINPQESSVFTIQFWE